jgi:hypothetical protein
MIENIPTIDPMIQLSVFGGFALLFAISAIDKFKDKDGFRFQLEAYQLVPAKLVPVIAPLLWSAELACATLLISPAAHYGALLGAVLLGGYTTGIWINIMRGRTHIDCGCLGSAGEGLSYYHVFRNVTMILILVASLLPTMVRELLWLDIFSGAAIILSGVLLYLITTLLIHNHMNARLWWH